ncbi:unnamed protein product, partial [Symbiodinium necroappetens]
AATGREEAQEAGTMDVAGTAAVMALARKSAEAEEEAGACRRRREEERQPMRQEIQELRLRNSALSAENASMASARAEYVEAVSEESAQRTLLRMNSEMFAGQHKMLEKVQSENSALSEQLAQKKADGDKSFQESQLCVLRKSHLGQAEHSHQVEDLEKRLKLQEDDCSEQIKRGRHWFTKCKAEDPTPPCHSLKRRPYVCRSCWRRKPRRNWPRRTHEMVGSLQA